MHGFPFSCISVGFAVGGKPVVGVVYNPSVLPSAARPVCHGHFLVTDLPQFPSPDSFLDQLYSAAKGQGSFLNETTRLPLVSPAPSLPSLSRALLGIECTSVKGA